MNKELKILAVVVFFTGLLYWGVEPYAHHAMHAKYDGQGNEIKIESHGFVYDGTTEANVNGVIVADLERKVMEEGSPEPKAVLAAKLAAAKDIQSKKASFWKEVGTIAELKGDATAGEAGFASCMGCHNGLNMNMGGVIPPNLDHAGALYDKNYLIALLKDPAMASNVDHKYADTSMHPMGSIKGTMSHQQIADVVAFMKEKKAAEPTAKQAFMEACVRCHAMRYDKVTQLGEAPKTKENIKTGHDIEAMKYAQKVAEEQATLATYMGKLPPDLSMIIRARSGHFMETFIEDPQTQLPGTSMPRVGLSEEGYEKVHQYLMDIGDPSKPARDIAAPWVLGFFVIFTILAYLWKRHQWKDLH
ncbi:MAG: ubiquinol cytochrome C oxidoreductase, cytochrome C1 subunit [uncultured Sulfurovum sp.]|uniref:Ubiquinol cytochrome C oxidoreductase, cytochrome C1 subunit n=1 Tax=uncultured Sulfurovum sp. TaxID=269237 RepID=A0A6S6S0R4_9BACT|nr:MAG: ubiquinol cytochrome C oxidoreductase, cytochrome C1 subunit [uncultured Sulfurovum sp.]